jgi:hypothetical protein
VSAQEDFDNLPQQFQAVDTESIVKYWLKGQLASANHPITVLNPDKYFTITDVRVTEGRIYVRGENTMWFSQSLIKVDVVGF